MRVSRGASEAAYTSAVEFARLRREAVRYTVVRDIEPEGRDEGT